MDMTDDNKRQLVRLILFKKGGKNKLFDLIPKEWCLSKEEFNDKSDKEIADLIVGIDLDTEKTIDLNKLKYAAFPGT